MKFNDTLSEYEYFADQIEANINDVIDSGIYLFGQQLQSFEIRFAEMIGVKYAVGVKNCTDALMLILSGLVRNRNTPIILPNFTAYPTARACKHVSDNLYYVDVDDTYTINVNKLPDIKNGIIAAVNLFGNNCSDKILFLKYARDNNHIIIEDCAQSTGSGSGKLGHYSAFSFYPTKPLAAMGDGGMICTDYHDDAEKLKIARVNKVNSRLDEIQAAILNAKLNKFYKLNEARKRIAVRYKNIIKGIRVPLNCIYHQFPMMYNNRDFIIEELNKRNIPFMIHYDNHVSEIPQFQGTYNDVGFRVSDRIISLPIHPFLSEIEIEQVEEFLYDTKNYEYQIV